MKTFILVTAACCLIACGSPSSNDKDSTPPPSPTTRNIGRADFGTDWPFTVESGTLECIQYEAKGVNPALLRGVVFQANGKKYAVNGTAQSRSTEYGYEPVTGIWAVDTGMTNSMVRVGVPYDKAVVKVNIGPIIDLGLTLCR